MEDLSDRICDIIKTKFDSVQDVADWESRFHELLFLRKSKWGQNIDFIIKIYNPIVLDKAEFTFETFRWGWSLQGMTKAFIKRFNDLFIREYLPEMSNKDIASFFEKHCIDMIDNRPRRQMSFCSKLWHCVFPDEYPIYDSNIARILCIGNPKYDFQTKMLGLIRGYTLYAQREPKKILQIRSALSQYKELRADSLSDMRIIDLGLWAVSGKL